MIVDVPLLRVQREFLHAKEDFVAIISSRSCGKSFICALMAVIDLLEGKNVIYMCQTDSAWYKGAWVHLQHFLDKFNLRSRWSWNSTYKTGTLDGSKLYVGTYENVAAARGCTECSTLYLDELMLSTPDVTAVLAPCLRGRDNRGNVIVPRIRAVSTPNMKSLWQIMVAEPSKYGIRVLRAKMSENTFMTDQQRQLFANSIFDPKLRAQEIEGEILLGEDATALISLQDFPVRPAFTQDSNVLAGLDMAKNGQRDSHVFAAVRGNTLLAFHEFGMCGSEEVAQWIRKFNSVYRIHTLNMDMAWSESVYDQLKYSIRCTQVPFAAKAPTEEDQIKYANIRAYGYFKLAKAHREEGLFVDVEPNEFIDETIVAEYKREICNTHFEIDKRGRLLIESKDDIHTRLMRSPDPADALMLATLDRRGIVDPKMVAMADKVKKKREEYASMMEDD